MAKLIDTGQSGPIRFRTPITPIGVPEGTFKLADTLLELAPIIQRNKEINAKNNAKSFNVNFDPQGRILDRKAREENIQAIGDRQQALEQLRTQNDLQINADKFYRKNYGKSLEQVQNEAQQAGMSLGEYNHVLNGEEFVLPPENSAAIDVIDQQLMAIDLDENLGPEDSLNQVLKLNEKRFELGKKQWRRPKTKPRTFDQMLGEGSASLTPDGGFIFQSGVDAQGRPEFKHVKPPKPGDAQQGSVSVGGVPIPSTILDADDIARERKKVFDSRKRGDQSTSQRAIDEEVLEGIRKSQPAEMRVLDAIEDRIARRRAPGDRVLKTGAMVRAERASRKRIVELNGLILAATKKQKGTPEFQKLLDELEQHLRFMNAGN